MRKYVGLIVLFTGLVSVGCSSTPSKSPAEQRQDWANSWDEAIAQSNGGIKYIVDKRPNSPICYGVSNYYPDHPYAYSRVMATVPCEAVENLLENGPLPKPKQ